MATLEEKQLYYNYVVSGWHYKTPPALDPFVRDELKKIGVDRYGDPLYRFNWGGVAVIRSEEDGVPYVRGDSEGTKINQGRLQPRYLDSRRKQPVALCYRNAKGEVVYVERVEQVPKRYVAFWEVQYVDFGQLFWYLERKLTPEQLVEAGYYRRNDPAIPSQGDYICIPNGKVVTPNGLYFEPTEQYLEAIKEHLYDANNETPQNLMLKDRAVRDKARETREAEEHASRQRIVETLMSRHSGFPVHELFQR